MLLLPMQPGTVFASAANQRASAASGHWGGPGTLQYLCFFRVWFCVVRNKEGNCSWFVTGPVVTVTEMALDFPTEQLRLLFYLLETQRQSQREEIVQGEVAHASVLRGKKR